MDFAATFESAGCTGSLHAIRISTGDEVSYEADQLQVMASVLKVPIGLEFYAQVDDGRFDPTSRVTISDEHRTPGPVGISQMMNDVTMSLQDLVFLMMTISDNAATDVIGDIVGLDAVNVRLNELGCRSTVVVESLQSMLDSFATDLGQSNYRKLLAAQRGDLGSRARSKALDPDRINASKALDPFRASRTTARDATKLLSLISRGEAASPAACTSLVQVMAQQVTRRLAPVVLNGGTLAAKSGGLFGRVRNEVAIVTDPGGESYAVAVFTRPQSPYVGVSAVDAAMVRVVQHALDILRGS